MTGAPSFDKVYLERAHMALEGTKVQHNILYRSRKFLSISLIKRKIAGAIGHAGGGAAGVLAVKEIARDE